MFLALYETVEYVSWVRFHFSVERLWPHLARTTSWCGQSDQIPLVSVVFTPELRADRLWSDPLRWMLMPSVNRDSELFHLILTQNLHMDWGRKPERLNSYLDHRKDILSARYYRLWCFYVVVSCYLNKSLRNIKKHHSLWALKYLQVLVPTFFCLYFKYFLSKILKPLYWTPPGHLERSCWVSCVCQWELMVNRSTGLTVSYCWLSDASSHTTGFRECVCNTKCVCCGMRVYLVFLRRRCVFVSFYIFFLCLSHPYFA